MTRSLPVLLVILLVGVCGISGYQVAKEARHTIVGMNADTVQVCDGIPTRTKRLDERRNESVGGVQVNFSIIGDGFKSSGTGFHCHAIIRVIDRKVAELNYTGDNDDQAGRESVCGPIVRSCVRAHDNDPEVETARSK